MYATGSPLACLGRPNKDPRVTEMGLAGKSKNTVTINEQVIPVGETYLKQLDKIQF